MTNKQKRSDLHSIKVLRFKTRAKNHEIPICMQTKQLTICIQIITSKKNHVIEFITMTLHKKDGRPLRGPALAPVEKYKWTLNELLGQNMFFDAETC